MSGQIEVNSLSALEQLETAIGRFASRFSEALADAERELARKRDRLEEIADDRRREVAYCRQAYDAADPEEDDVGALGRQLEAAEDNLSEARRWRARVEESCDAYLRRSGQGKLLSTEHTHKARVILKQKIDDLHAYLSLQADASAAGGGGPVVVPALFDSSSAAQPAGLDQGAGGPSAQVHEKNHRDFMEQFSQHNIELKDSGQQYVAVGDLMALKSGADEWNEQHERFWCHHGNPPEFYQSMAQQYPILRERLASGKSLEELKLDPDLKTAVEFWYSEADRVKVIHFRDSYFVDSGFHRVVLARQQGFADIFCIVSEARLKDQG
jgi:hypothetical protein